MDGHFVPNLTIGPPVIEAIRKRTRLPLDVHLMIEDPERCVETYVEGGRRLRSPSTSRPARTFSATLARSGRLGARAGVALNPSTPPDVLEYVLDDARPGAGHVGQPGLRRPVVHPRDLREDPVDLRSNRSPTGRSTVSVDGGVKVEHCRPSGAGAGPPMLVAGSAIFGASDPAAEVRRFRAAALSAATT